MDTTYLEKYNDALNRQKLQLESYISTNTGSVPVPTEMSEVKTGKKNFLTDSGWVFIVLGALAFVAGLVIGTDGLWIAGAIAITSGIYCIIKGRRQLRREAFSGVVDDIVGSVDRIVADVSRTWTGFVRAQNQALRSDIVTNDGDTAAKVAELGKVTETAWYHVDMEKVRGTLDEAAAKENLAALHSCLPKVGKILTASLDTAAHAQSDIYASLAAS